jgi:hypothetical protein
MTKWRWESSRRCGTESRFFAHYIASESHEKIGVFSNMKNSYVGENGEPRHVIHGRNQPDQW